MYRHVYNKEGRGYMKREPKFLLIISLLVVLTITSPSVLLSNYSILPAISSSSSSPLSLLPTIIQTARADVDIDTSGNGKAAAFDGKNSISSDGKGFCNTVDNIAGGKFAPLFSGIVNCKSSNNPNHYSIDYSVIKDPVKVGDTTYMSVTIRDKYTDQPVSDVLVLLTIEPPNFNPSIDKTTTTQTAYTDKDGHATFTVQIGPRSSSGIYNTNLEIKKDNYDSKIQKAFNVV